MSQSKNKAENKGQAAGATNPTSTSSKANGTRPASDKLWINEIFKDPIEILNYVLPPRIEFTRDCLFVLDTSALLAPYDLGSQSIVEIQKIYRSLAREERLYVPAHAIREYAKNRSNVVSRIATQIQDRLSKAHSFDHLRAPVLNGIREHEDVAETLTNINKSIELYREKLRALKSLLDDWRWDDAVSNLYRNIFKSDQIVDHEYSKVELTNDHAWRLSNLIPPGFCDEDKEDSGIGDMAIWHSTLHLATQKNKNILLISNDSKKDWLVKTSKDAAVTMLRPELAHEFHAKTKLYMQIMNWPEFLKTLNASEGTVKEARLSQSTLSRQRAKSIGLVMDLLNELNTLLQSIRSTVAPESRSGQDEETTSVPPEIFLAAQDRFNDAFLVYKNNGGDDPLVNELTIIQHKIDQIGRLYHEYWEQASNGSRPDNEYVYRILMNINMFSMHRWNLYDLLRSKPMRATAHRNA